MLEDVNNSKIIITLCSSYKNYGWLFVSKCLFTNTMRHSVSPFKFCYLTSEFRNRIVGNGSLSAFCSGSIIGFSDNGVLDLRR